MYIYIQIHIHTYIHIPNTRTHTHTHLFMNVHIGGVMHALVHALDAAERAVSTHRKREEGGRERGAAGELL